MFSKCIATKGRFQKVISAALFGALCASGVLGNQLPRQAQSQIDQQAAILATRPSKVSLTIAAQEINQGTKSPVQITLLNAENEPVAARADWQCEVTLGLPSGKSTLQKVLIKKGESTAQFEFSADQAGVTSISVRTPVSSVRPDNITVFVRPKRPERPLVACDNRQYPSEENITVGSNRFANLTFKVNQVAIEYRDLKNNLLPTENWQVSSGNLSGNATPGSQVPGLTQHQSLALATR